MPFFIVVLLVCMTSVDVLKMFVEFECKLLVTKTFRKDLASHIYLQVIIIHAWYQRFETSFGGLWLSFVQPVTKMLRKVP